VTAGQLIDLESERLVAAAVLNGEIALSELDPFVPEYVTDPILRGALKAVTKLPKNGAELSLGDVVAAMRKRNITGPIGADLQRLCDETPSTSTPCLRRVAAELAELAWRRSLRRRLATLEAKIGTGEIGYTEACASLREYVETEGRDAAGEEAQRLEYVDIWVPLPPLAWLVEQLDLCPGVAHLLAGYGFSGKTVAAQAMAFEVVAGLPVWGTFPARKGRVVHIDYEQGWRLTAERYQRIAKGYGYCPDEVVDSLKLVSRPPVYLDTTGAQDIFMRELDGFDLAIVDSLKAAAPTIEENSADARRVLDMLSRVSERTGCTVLVIHHARKPSQDRSGGIRMAIRGSGALYDAAGSVLVLEAEKGQPVRASHEKARTSGKLADDFKIHITDTETDPDDAPGLRVIAERIGVVTPEQQAQRRLAAIQDRIRERYAGQDPLPSRRAIRTELTGNREDVYAAIDLMVTHGDLVEAGSGTRKKLSWPGTN